MKKGISSGSRRYHTVVPSANLTCRKPKPQTDWPISDKTGVSVIGSPQLSMVIPFSSASHKVTRPFAPRISQMELIIRTNRDACAWWSYWSRNNLAVWKAGRLPAHGSRDFGKRIHSQSLKNRGPPSPPERRHLQSALFPVCRWRREDRRAENLRQQNAHCAQPAAPAVDIGRAAKLAADIETPH